eukprot:TRINITY_DN578_c0_g1_i1.p1 TRINITY_DN578_c0_g1~~TRINITY_DN578_c0_g1_i1.p1  ORF type:complete len:351 (-),score=114.22 TRINITY_DN578_c0_g1_i1:2-1054(-)
MGELRSHLKPSMLKKDKNDFVTDLLKKVGKRLKHRKDKETKAVDDMKMMQKTINIREKEIKSLRSKMRSILAKLNKSEKETEMKAKQIVELDDMISSTPEKPSTPACTIPEHKHLKKELFELKRKMRKPTNGRNRRLTIQIDNEIQKDQFLPKLESLPESGVICENSVYEEEAPELDNNSEDDQPVTVKKRSKSVNQSNTVKVDTANAMVINEKFAHIGKLKKQNESSKQSKDSPKSTSSYSPKLDLKSDVKKLQKDKILMEGKIIELEVQLREALQKNILLKISEEEDRIPAAKNTNEDLPAKLQKAKSPALGEARVMIKEQTAELKLTKKKKYRLRGRSSETAKAHRG